MSTRSDTIRLGITNAYLFGSPAFGRGVCGRSCDERPPFVPPAIIRHFRTPARTGAGELAAAAGAGRAHRVPRPRPAVPRVSVTCVRDSLPGCFQRRDADHVALAVPLQSPAFLTVISRVPVAVRPELNVPWIVYNDDVARN